MSAAYTMDKFHEQRDALTKSQRSWYDALITRDRALKDCRVGAVSEYMLSDLQKKENVLAAKYDSLQREILALHGLRFELKNGTIPSDAAAWDYRL